MKVIAINGGPRKNWNTAALLKSALEGAAAGGAETEMVHLYDLNYKGCTSCFACKRLGSKSYGKCAMLDDLTPIFERIEGCDAVVIGSPIYIGTVTGELRSFLERFIFQYYVYDKAQSATLFKKKLPIGMIYTMNVTEEQLAEAQYKVQLQFTERLMRRVFGDIESLYVTDTVQFDDYSKYMSELFDPVQKAERRQKVFPGDLRRACEMGRRLTRKPEK